MFKKGLVLGFVLLFILIYISPMAFGSDSELLQKDDYLENLAFYYYDEYDSSKFEYYKKYSQSDSSEITDLEELTETGDK